MGARKGRTSVAAIVAVLGVGVGMASCSSGPQASGASPSLGEKVQNLILLGTTNPPPAPALKQSPTEVNCPPVDIQAGTGAYQLYDGGHQGDPFNLRYQARFGQFARQCDVHGDQVTVRIGISGRLIVGPKGDSGRVLPVPVRVALLDFNDKPVFSKLTTLSVAIPAGSGGADFSEVVEVPPMPIPRERLYGWSIKIGFDAKGVAAKPAEHRRTRHRAAQSPSLRLR